MTALEDILLDLLNLEPEKKERKRRELKEAIEKDHLKFIDDIGFYTWSEIRKNGKLYIWVTDMYIIPEERNKPRFFEIRKFLKEKYPDAEFGYWWSRKRNRFYYVRRMKC